MAETVICCRPWRRTQNSQSKTEIVAIRGEDTVEGELEAPAHCVCHAGLWFGLCFCGFIRSTLPHGATLKSSYRPWTSGKGGGCLTLTSGSWHTLLSTHRKSQAISSSRCLLAQSHQWREPAGSGAYPSFNEYLLVAWSILSSLWWQRIWDKGKEVCVSGHGSAYL